MNLKTTRPVLEFAVHVKDLTGGLSAAVPVGDDLWVACDELTSVERLTLRDGAVFGGHRSFELHQPAGPLTLPAGGRKPNGKKGEEIDIEGMDFDGGYLWLVGSHSIKRKKVDEDESEEANIVRLATTEAEGNRFLLARMPLARDGETGESVLAAASSDGSLKAAQLDPATTTDNALTRAILGEEPKAKPDPHLEPWLTLPGKDNGFDIEGLAVAGGRVLLGLRGPVLRGWAVVLELHLEDDAGSGLKLKQIDPEGRPYRKHFLDLGGLGVRDLCADGEDLLVLAGPTMTHDGPVRVCRWPGGMAKEGETLVRAEELNARALTIPHGAGADRAEGFALLPGGNPPSILVVYDAPSDDRKVGDNAVRAEVFGLP